jgi:hypothetical protein
VRFTRDRPQDGDALSRDPKTTVANDVSRIDAHEPTLQQMLEGLNQSNQ